MKKWLIILSITLASCAVSEPPSIYICKSQYGKKYHYKKTCFGLRACTHEIEKVTLEEAQAEGKTLCGWED